MLHALQEQRHQLLEHPDEDLLSKETLKQVERDLRYFQGRVDHAIPVDLAAQPTDEIGFGAIVRCVDESGQEHEFAIVGEDERSEEHTSELQSLMRISYAVFCLQKKKNNIRKQ